jgi:hypothetical protein
VRAGTSASIAATRAAPASGVNRPRTTSEPSSSPDPVAGPAVPLVELGQQLEEPAFRGGDVTSRA